MNRVEPQADSSYDTGIFAHLGLTFTLAEEGRIVGSLVVGPEHLNRMGYVHGGVLCTMLDAGACCAGLFSPPGRPTRYAITLSLATQFTRAVKSGRLTVEGRQISGSRKIYTGEARVLDEQGELVAHGIGTFSWRPGSSPDAMNGSTPA
jgi:uncharacterized protein (TIGR00369 family)